MIMHEIDNGESGPESAIRQTYRRGPIGAPSIWSEEEDAIIRIHYPTKGTTGLFRLSLLKKTASQIKARANYLGVVILPEYKTINFRRNSEDLSSITDIKSPFAAYMLGFLWADGWVSKTKFTIRLIIIDEDFNDIKPDWLASAKSWIYFVYDDGNPEHKRQARVTIHHREFHDFLVQNDYLFKSGYSADSILDKIPIQFRNYWWRGYFDGDGCFMFKGSLGRVILSGGYGQDWTFFDRLAKTIGLDYSLRHQKYTNHSSSEIIIQDEANVRRFMDHIYQGEMFGLKRKRKKYEEFLAYKSIARPNKSSAYRGVSKHSQCNRWKMQICCKKQFYRKLFKTETEAAQEYDRLALELFGNKAMLNFPKAA